MKYRYFLTALAASLALLTSCQDEIKKTIDEVQLSQTYVAIDKDGGSTKVSLNAADSWVVKTQVEVADENGKKKKVGVDPASENWPSWLGVEPGSGAAGQHEITFSAEGYDGGRSLEIWIECAGKKQNLFIVQGLLAPADATCAEVLAGPDSKSYRVTGAVSKIVETATYGNWYIKDDTGEVYIYGTKYEGQTKQGALDKLKIEVGDVLTVEGPKTTHNGTVELVDVDIVKIVKSLLTIVEPERKVAKDACSVEFKLVYKGDDLNVEPESDWLSLGGIKANKDTSYVTINVAANEADTRSGRVKVSSSIEGQTTEVYIEIVQATGLSMYSLPYAEDFSNGIGAFEIQVISPREDEGDIWTASSNNGTYFMKASAYGDKAYPSVSMLVSPKISLSDVTSPVLTFEHSGKYFGDQLSETGLWVSTDNCETWTQLYMPQHDNKWGWQPSGDISLASLVGKEYFQIGFKYTSTAEKAGTWEIKDVKVEDRAAELKSIAELNNSAVAAEAEFTATLTDAVVTYVSGGNAFIEDATGGIQLYKKEHGLVEGTKISGTVKGKIKLYGGYAEMTDLDLTGAELGQAEVEPTVIALDVLLGQYLRWQNCLVKIENVTLDTDLDGDHRDGTLTQGEASIAARLQDKTVKFDKGAIDLVCIPTRYNDKLQIGIWDAKHRTAK